MYKRKVRILFLAAHPAAYAQMAEAYARHLGNRWLEPRSACLTLSHAATLVRAFPEGNSVHEDLPPPALFAEDMLGWADLVVTLGGREEEFGLSLPPGARRKHWGLAKSVQSHETNEQLRIRLRSAQDEIERRVQGIIGGIRLLAHSDGDSPGSDE